MLRTLTRAVAVTTVVAAAGAFPPAAPFILAVATPVAMIDQRHLRRKPATRRRRAPSTAATRRSTPAALR